MLKESTSSGLGVGLAPQIKLYAEGSVSWLYIFEYTSNNAIYISFFIMLSLLNYFVSRWLSIACNRKVIDTSRKTTKVKY